MIKHSITQMIQKSFQALLMLDNILLLSQEQATSQEQQQQRSLVLDNLTFQLKHLPLLQMETQPIQAVQLLLK